MIGTIKVFQHGKGTLTEWPWSPGKICGKIKRAGRGRFFERAFASASEAKDFCETELPKDRSAIFYVLENDVIVETILDTEFQRTKERASVIRWNTVSVVIVAAVSWLLFVKGAPFQSMSANLALAGVAVLIYLMVLWTNNWNPVESMIEILMALVLAYMLLGMIMKVRARRQKNPKPSASLTVHIRGLSSPFPNSVFNSPLSASPVPLDRFSLGRTFQLADVDVNVS